MPRPGPRPYECVKRAWHSDRHKPMRGSIIQEIFRLANEIHSPATRKNKEWQEKLPVVVIKAEEIMYSKANSEAEYFDLKTIWERTNEAIDTIIRRDESSESGEFLQPCIEAALNLGCTPRRASRSQRHNPRFYLSSSRQEASETSVAPHTSDNTIYQGPSHLLPPATGNAVPSPRSHFALNTPAALTCLGSSSGRYALQGKSFPYEQGGNPQPVSCHGFPRFENCAISCHEDSARNLETYPLPSLGRTYPLYYSSSHRIVEPNNPFASSQESNRGTFIVNGPPQPIADAKTGLFQNILDGKISFDASNRTARGSLSLGGTPETLPDMGCDLSLRLGPLPVPCLNRDSSSAFADVVSSSSRDGRRLCDLSPHRVVASNFDCSSSQRDKEFCFFPNYNFDNTSETPFSKWNSAGGSLNMENPNRKRKAPISSSFEDEHFSWWPKPSQSQFYDRTQGPSS